MTTPFTDDLILEIDAAFSSPTFYLTFGQQSTARDGYIIVKAKDYDAAREMVLDRYAQNWSMLYDEDDFKGEYFPVGCLGLLGF